MRKRIPKAPAGEEGKAPGQWWHVRAAASVMDWYRQRYVAEMSCPTCGKSLMMSRAVHSVDAAGTVSPSMVCPYPPCGFHEFIQLEEWSEPSGPEVADEQA